MALSTIVYVRNVNNLSDARYCAGMGVDFVGFNLNPNDADSINQELFKEISGWISGVKIVAEFGNLPMQEVLNQINLMSIDAVLVENTDDIEEIANSGKSVILKVDLDNQDSDLISKLNFSSVTPDYIVMVTEEQPVNLKDKQYISEISSVYPTLLDSGITSNDIQNSIKELKLSGISLKGSSEIRPGFKDFDSMADILEVLEVD